MNSALGYAGYPISERGSINPFSREVSAELCSARYEVIEGQVVRKSAHLFRAALGSVNIVRFEGDGVSRVDRRPDHVREDGGDHFVLCLPVSAQLGMRHDGVESSVGPGEFIFISTLKPFQAAMLGLGTDGSCSSLLVKVPGPLLRQRISDIDRCCNRPMEIQRGYGFVMRAMVELALQEGKFMSEIESTRFAELLLDAISEATQQQIAKQGRANLSSRPSSSMRTLERARAYIGAHLSNPELCAGEIAAHCRVSVRYLHAAFAPTGTSMAGFVRERRLQQIQTELKDEKLRHLSIIEIAGRWGFEDPAHFSRTYKLRFGRTPTDDRRPQ